MVTVADLRTELIQLGLTAEEANSIKGKQELLNTIEKLKLSNIDNVGLTLENVLEGNTTVSDLKSKIFETNLCVYNGENLDMAETSTPETEVETKEIGYFDEEWSDYVLSLLTDKEKENEVPKINGLRRLTEQLLGQIVNTKPISLINGVCIYEVQILWQRNSLGHIDNQYATLRTYGGIGSANEGNTDGEYSKYAEAVAETRAEGRALRKALRLNCLFAEEMAKKNSKDKAEVDEFKTNEKVSSTSVALIKSLCDRLNVKIDDYTGGRQLESITRGEASEIIALLNQIQTGRVNPNETK